jgi:hypothetical protein
LQPARPKLEIELPYKLYRLVRADGSLAERADKHPFCMSRVYYDATEKPEEVGAMQHLAGMQQRQQRVACGMRPNTVVVPRHPAAPLLPRCLQVWAELADGSCRWRQTGGEVKVLALRVPKDLPTRQLAVAIEPYSLKGGRLWAWQAGHLAQRCSRAV